MSWLRGSGTEAAPAIAGTAARRTWAATAWLVAGTIAVAVAGYSLSLKVADERQATERLARQNRLLAMDLKALDAELRVRMRMPQLQSWNDRVLGLVPISASQYLGSPLRLADYGRATEQAPGAALPARPQYAVRDQGPSQQPAAQLVRVALPAAAPAPRPARLTEEMPAPRPVRLAEEAPTPRLVRPAEEAPADLLQQVHLVFGAPSALAP